MTLGHPAVPSQQLMWLTIVKTWLPLFPTGQPSPKAFLDSACHREELVERPRCCLNGVVHCLCGRSPKELLHLFLAFELQSSRSVLDSLHRQVKRLAPLLTNLSAWFAVVESRSKSPKVKAVDAMHAFLMPTWSRCECC